MDRGVPPVFLLIGVRCRGELMEGGGRREKDGKDEGGRWMGRRRGRNYGSGRNKREKKGEMKGREDDICDRERQVREGKGRKEGR